MLTPTDEDLRRINDMGVMAGILEGPIAMKDLIDRQFIPLDIKPANIDAGGCRQTFMWGIEKKLR